MRFVKAAVTNADSDTFHLRQSADYGHKQFMQPIITLLIQCSIDLVAPVQPSLKKGTMGLQ
jgi:hypothetical protein